MNEHAPNPSDDSTEQIEVRKHKLEKLKDAGVSVYSNDFRPSHSAGALTARYSGA